MMDLMIKDKGVCILIGLLFFSFGLSGQIPLPAQLPQGHPRLMTGPDGKPAVEKLIREEKWAGEVLTGIKKRIDPYTDRLQTEPEWLVSRLQMYWKGCWTDVYVKGEVFDHAGGEKAPAPTVRYSGARSTATIYGRPGLEDVLPYMDDERGIFFHNNAKEGRPLEWAEPGKTGRNIESINNEILGLARDAAFLWWLTGEHKYGQMAAGIFDVYMTGIYYRNVPIDLNNGHQQTLVGLTTFEVIHEDALSQVMPLYDFLYDFLKQEKSDKMQIYASAFKKWADNIIANGVPHNNWDLYQAGYIMRVGLILEDNRNYSDGKGREYYLDYVLNRSSIRQWSLTRLADYGFDPQTGIWAECPGYSCGVVGDFTNFVSIFDRNLNYDLLPQMPVIGKAVAALPQYLFPSGIIAGFGDTHPSKLRTDVFARMVANAQQHGKKEQERQFTAMLKYFDPKAALAGPEGRNIRAEVSSFFADRPLVLDPSIPAGKIEDFVSPTFWVPKVSWFVQRNGMDPQHSLMISQNASEGNHMHANGINMELYGKGYILGPDAGIGSNYFSLDYAEYYGQFPAHNTVCVDGISSYPIMKSNHAFELRSCYPQPERKEGIYKGVSYSDVSFREPESRADQTRTMSIVTTGPSTGYYVDIFRSRKEKGGDKMHDYFYHNLGQDMVLSGSRGEDLGLQPTDELAFAGAHLYAYSYFFDKKSAETDKDIKALFTVSKPDGDEVYMNLWMKGEKDREVFSALAPMTEGLSRTPGMPYVIKDQPTLTFVARQKGEAWTRPFVAVFEPSSKGEPSDIATVHFFDAKTRAKDFAGICVENKSGRKDYIFSGAGLEDLAVYQDMAARAIYALIGTGEGNDRVLFMGHGQEIRCEGYAICTDMPASATLEIRNGKYFYTSDAPVRLTIPKGKLLKLAGKNYKIQKGSFELPASGWTQIELLQ